MEPPPHYQPYLEELLAWATGEDRRDEVLEAKRRYFELTGEVFEDDPIFEARMAGFLDYYLFDRPLSDTGKTPARSFYEARLEEGDAERANAFRGFTETVHGLFVVRKLKPGIVRLRELSTQTDYEVSERRNLAGVEKGDVLEARLIPFGGYLFFSSAFGFHAREVASAIVKEAKRRRKKEPERLGWELTRECARRALKAARYKQLPVKRVYDFANKV